MMMMMMATMGRGMRSGRTGPPDSVLGDTEDLDGLMDDDEDLLV